MTQITFYNDDYSFIKFHGDQGIIRELKDIYSFMAPNHKYDKRFKMGYWDGRISLFNTKDNSFRAGILPLVLKYLDDQGIKYENKVFIPDGKNLSKEQVINFYEKIKGPFTPHDSQIDAFQRCIGEGRNIILAPTSNGKSYIIHGLNAYYKLVKNLKTLIVIDRAQLVLQLQSNFVDEYGSNEFYTTSTIYDDKDTDVVITTWQSIIDKPQSWFRQFGVIIGDEVHRHRAKSLISIMDKLDHVEFRHGFTATLDNDSKSDALSIQGLFGVAHQTITLEEQIESGISARPIVYAIILKYPVDDRKELINLIQRTKTEAASKGKTVTDAIGFQIESKYLEEHNSRNNFIKKLTLSQVGNTLVAFKNHNHGKTLHELISASSSYETFFANSTVKKEKRFEIQKRIEELQNSIAVVSFGTFSTGINIPNLNNLIIASQVKSGITVPQLVGRMIRLSENKTTANIIDICDDLSHGRSKNVFYKHFESRMKFYIKNNFTIHTKIINLC